MRRRDKFEILLGLRGEHEKPSDIQKSGSRDLAPFSSFAGVEVNLE